MSMIANFVAVAETQLASLRETPEKIEEFLEAVEDRAIDVDKAWHAIHFLLTGSAWGGELPLAFVVHGPEIGDVDVGYGPARCFSNADVRGIASALETIDATSLTARWDADAIRQQEIYGVDPDAKDLEVEYVGGYFTELKKFIDRTATDGLGMIVFLS